MVIKNTEQQEFIDGFDGIDPIRTFGFEFSRGDSPLFIFRRDIDQTSPRNLENYLFEYRTTSWQRFRAKYFGSRFLLGNFKKVGHMGYTDWFLFWCSQCRQFQVNYKRGFAQRLDCESCLCKSYP